MSCKTAESVCVLRRYIFLECACHTDSKNIQHLRVMCNLGVDKNIRGKVSISDSHVHVHVYNTPCNVHTCAMYTHVYRHVHNTPCNVHPCVMYTHVHEHVHNKPKTKNLGGNLT